MPFEMRTVDSEESNPPWTFDSFPCTFSLSPLKEISMFSKKILFVSFVLLASACSTAKVRILPGEGGMNKVVSTDYESDGAEKAAIDQATDYCKDRGKQVVFIDPDSKSKYTGKMDEGTRHAIKKASQAAVILGGGVGGATRDPVLGGAIGTAGVIGHEAVNDRDYMAEWTFKCQ